jgi:CRP-like cAMP-binding protein
VELARVMSRRTVPEGEILWRQGDDAREMLFVVDGAVSASLQAPGDRTVEIGRVVEEGPLARLGCSTAKGTR